MPRLFRAGRRLGPRVAEQIDAGIIDQSETGAKIQDFQKHVGAEMSRRGLVNSLIQKAPRHLKRTLGIHLTRRQRKQFKPQWAEVNRRSLPVHNHCRCLRVYGRFESPEHPASSKKVYYHGTDQEFETFDKTQIKLEGSGGFWFTTSKEYAQGYRPGGTVKEYNLDVKNPAPYEEYQDAAMQARGNAQERTEQIQNVLRSRGYDGVKNDFGDGLEWVIEFDNEQIRTASGSSGGKKPPPR